MGGGPLVGASPPARAAGAQVASGYTAGDTITGFIRGILRGVRYAKSLRVLFLHRRSPSWTTLVLYSRVVFIFNEPTILLVINPVSLSSHSPFLCIAASWAVFDKNIHTIGAKQIY